MCGIETAGRNEATAAWRVVGASLGGRRAGRPAHRAGDPRAAGKTVYEDGMAPPLNYVTITGYVFLGFLMLFESVSVRGLRGIQGRWREWKGNSGT